MKLTKYYHFKHPLKCLLATFFDLMGSAFVSLFRLFCRQKSFTKKMQKVLLIRIDHLGDLLMAKPAFELCREKFPEADIDLMIAEEYTSLFEFQPGIREIVSLKNGWFSRTAGVWHQWQTFWGMVSKLKKESYDAAIDFRGDLRTILLMFFAGISFRYGYGQTGGGFLLKEQPVYEKDLHQVEQNLRLVYLLADEVLKTSHNLSKIKFDDITKDQLRQRLGLTDMESEVTLFVHAGAGRAEKLIPSEFYESLFHKLSEKQNRVMLVGTEEDKAQLDVSQWNDWIVDLRGKTSLQELAMLLDCRGVYLGLDSGPTHLAACQGLSVICLFVGEDDPKVWHPFTEKLKLIVGRENVNLDRVCEETLKAIEMESSQVG